MQHCERVCVMQSCPPLHPTSNVKADIKLQARQYVYPICRGTFSPNACPACVSAGWQDCRQLEWSLAHVVHHQPLLIAKKCAAELNQPSSPVQPRGDVAVDLQRVEGASSSAHEERRGFVTGDKAFEDAHKLACRLAVRLPPPQLCERVRNAE